MIRITYTRYLNDYNRSENTKIFSLWGNFFLTYAESKTIEEEIRKSANSPTYPVWDNGR